MENPNYIIDPESIPLDDRSAWDIRYRASLVFAQDQIEEHGFEEWLKTAMPKFIECKDLFPADHEIHDLIRRWDPEAERLREEFEM